MVKKTGSGVFDKKRPQIFITIMLLALVCYFFPFGNVNFGGGWYVCIRFLDDGVLYGGKPYCNQAPLIFYYGLFLYRFFGLDLIDYLMYATVVVLWVVLAYSMKRILDALEIRHPFLFTVCFILLVVPSSVNNPAVLFSTVFLVAGFYLLFHSESRFSELRAGVLFALSLFFKYPAVYPIAIITLFYIKDLVYTGKGLGFTSKLSLLIMPTLILLLYFTPTYPNFLAYTVKSQLASPQSSLIDSILVLLQAGNIHAIANLLVFFMLVFALNLKYFKGFEIYPVTSFSIMLTSLSLTHSHGEYQLPGYYALPAYPFLIFSLLILYEKSLKVFTALFIIAFVYPSIVSNPLTELRNSYLLTDVNTLRHDVKSGLGFLPPQDGWVLVETTREYRDTFSEFNVAGVDASKIRFIMPGKDFNPPIDPFWGHRLREVLGNDSVQDPVKLDLTRTEQEIRSEIIEGRYSLIVYGPPSMITISLISYTLPRDVLDDYCEVSVPDFYYFGSGRRYLTVILRNKTHCPQMARNMAGHYIKIFDSVCGRSQKAAEVILKINEKNGYIIKKNCRSNVNPRYSDTSLMQLFDVIVVLISVAVAYNTLRRGK